MLMKEVFSRVNCKSISFTSFCSKLVAHFLFCSLSFYLGVSLYYISVSINLSPLFLSISLTSRLYQISGILSLLLSIITFQFSFPDFLTPLYLASSLPVPQPFVSYLPTRDLPCYMTKEI